MNDNTSIPDLLFYGLTDAVKFTTTIHFVGGGTVKHEFDRRDIMEIRNALTSRPPDIAWTPELEKARVELAEFWTDISNGYYDKLYKTSLEIKSRAKDTEAALTILGTIANIPNNSEEVVDKRRKPVTMWYTNWRGEKGERRIIPWWVRYGKSAWHPDRQWLLLAFDVDKQQYREFALKDFSGPPAPDGNAQEIERLTGILNTPILEPFVEAAVSEARHQVYRWGDERDAQKTAWDWFWHLGYLGGKAAHAALARDWEKAKHHTVTAAALLANWHRHICNQEKE